MYMQKSLMPQKFSFCPFHRYLSTSRMFVKAYMRSMLQVLMYAAVAIAETIVAVTNTSPD